MKRGQLERTFSRKLKFFMRVRDWSVMRTAREAGISRQQLRDLLLVNKSATLKTVAKLARALRVPVEYLVR